MSAGCLQKAKAQSSDVTSHGRLERWVPYEGPRIVQSSGTSERTEIPDFGDCVVTGVDGEVAMELKGSGHVKLGPNSHACVLDAEPTVLIVVAGRVSAQFDDPNEHLGLTLATNHGRVLLSPGSEVWLSQETALEHPNATEPARLLSQAYLALLHGTALLFHRAELAGDEKRGAIQGPCAVGFGLLAGEPAPRTLDEAGRAAAAARVRHAPSIPVQGVDSELEKSLTQLAADTKWARVEFSAERARADPAGYRQAYGAYAQHSFHTHVRASLAVEMSVVEVLSGCAARGQRESDCAAFTAWREKYLSRIRANFVGADRGRQQTSLED